MVESYKISGFDALIAAITDPEPEETPEVTEATPEVTEESPKSTRKKSSK